MNLKKQFITGSLWVVVGRGSSNAMSFVVFAVIARFLGPADFGLVAFAAIFIDLSRALALSGIPQALIRGETWDQRTASTAFWLNIACSALLALIVSAAVGPVLGHFYGPQIMAVIAALSLTFVIESLSSVHEANLQRSFGYRALANRTLVGTLGGGVVGVAMAVSGFGVWALVGSRLASSTIQAVTLWTTVKWSPSMTFSRSEAKSLMSYGAHLGSSAIVGKLNLKTAEIVIGIFSNTVGVGLYRVGSRTVTMINDVVVAPLQATALTALSRANERGNLANAYLRIIKSCGLLAFPVYFGTAMIAPDFTTLFFGEKWASTGQIMSMLAIGGAASTILAFTHPALVAVGRTRFVFWNSLLNLGINVALALATVHWGATAVAFGYSVRAYIAIPFALAFLHKAIDVDFMKAMQAVFPTFLAATVMAGVLYLMREHLLTGFHPLPRMLLMVAAGGVLYAVALFAIGRKFVLEIKDEVMPLLAGFKTKKQAPANIDA